MDGAGMSVQPMMEEIRRLVFCARCGHAVDSVGWLHNTNSGEMRLTFKCHGRQAHMTIDRFDQCLQAGMRLEDLVPRALFTDERNPRKTPLSLLWGRHRRAA